MYTSNEDLYFQIFADDFDVDHDIAVTNTLYIFINVYYLNIFNM